MLDLHNLIGDLPSESREGFHLACAACVDAAVHLTRGKRAAAAKVSEADAQAHGKIFKVWWSIVVDHLGAPCLLADAEPRRALVETKSQWYVSRLAVKGIEGGRERQKEAPVWDAEGLQGYCKRRFAHDTQDKVDEVVGNPRLEIVAEAAIY